MTGTNRAALLRSAGARAEVLARIKLAVRATKFDGEKPSSNAANINAVVRTNVGMLLAKIRRGSPMLAEMEKCEAIALSGAIYSLATGMVQFMA